MQGIACELLDEKTGHAQKGRYSIDKQLKKMTMRSTEGADVKHVFSLASIQEIHRYEDAESVFPACARALPLVHDTLAVPFRGTDTFPAIQSRGLHCTFSVAWMRVPPTQ